MQRKIRTYEENPVKDNLASHTGKQESELEIRSKSEQDLHYQQSQYFQRSPRSYTFEPQIRRQVKSPARSFVMYPYGNYRKSTYTSFIYEYDKTAKLIVAIVSGKGVSLWELSEEMYGNGKYYSEIARFNGIENPDIIHTGDRIYLPFIKELTDDEYNHYISNILKIAETEAAKELTKDEAKEDKESKESKEPSNKVRLFKKVKLIPEIPKYEYYEHWMDWIAAIDNAIINTANGCIDIVNGLASEVKYIYDYGIVNYGEQAYYSYKDMALSIINAISNEIKYVKTTSIEKQFENALNLYKSPEYWEQILTIITSVVAADKLSRFVRRSKFIDKRELDKGFLKTRKVGSKGIDKGVDISYSRVSLLGGLSPRLQKAIIDSLNPGEVVGIRSRPVLAQFFEKYPAKGPSDIVTKKRFYGVRILEDESKVVSDLDLAFFSKNGKSFADSGSRNLGRKIKNKYNEYKIVTHGDNYNGQKKGIAEAIDIANRNEIIHIFNKNGYIGAGRYKNMIKKYIYKEKELFKELGI